MRSSRLLLILLHLQAHGRTTAADLAQRLEVSERTIYRDMDALSAAGVPVVADRGVGGGWYLLDDYRTNLTGLNEDEIRTLFLANATHVLDDLGLQQAAEVALVKLLASLPDRHRRNAEYVRDRIHVEGTRRPSTPEDLTWLSTLQEAIWDEHKIKIRYQRGDGVEIERVVDPLGLVAKGAIWYLVAAHGDEFRTYRVSRISDVQIQLEQCQRPQGFDLAEHWETSTAQFLASLPQYRVTLRVDASRVQWLSTLWRYARIESTEAPDAADRQIIHVLVETEEEALAYVLGCGPRAEVLSPSDLIERLKTTVQAWQHLQN